MSQLRRSPYGERGLKFLCCLVQRPVSGSLSLRRAWIEIGGRKDLARGLRVALLTESVD